MICPFLNLSLVRCVILCPFLIAVSFWVCHALSIAYMSLVWCAMLCLLFTCLLCGVPCSVYCLHVSCVVCHALFIAYMSLMWCAMLCLFILPVSCSVCRVPLFASCSVWHTLSCDKFVT
jgi:hypothetical protein